MGGCVLSLMDRKASKNEVTWPYAEDLKKYGPYSRPVSGTETDTSSPIYLNGAHCTPEVRQQWSNTYYNGPNQTERFAKLCQENLDDVALTYRRIERVTKEQVEGTSRPMDVAYLSNQRSVQYRELWHAILGFSRGLAELGLQARANISIYEETRWEWLAAIYGVWMQDMVASTVYANLGEDALFYALHETECKAIVCNGKSVPNLLRGVASGAFPACTLIFFDALPAAGCAELHGCRVVAWSDVVALGHGAGAQRAAAPPTDNDAVALIMYTSGTTGDPKGVIHTHGSIVSGITAMEKFLDSLLPLDANERYCAYLPLAHILEFGVVNVFLSRGATIGFGSPRTLTDATAKPHGDFVEYKPRCIIAVPRVFDTVKRAVEAKLPPPGSVARQVFDRAYQSRLASLKAGKETPYWNAKVFKKARAALGGNYQLLLSGGGPLSASTQEWVNVVLGYIVNGWGLTETICVGAIQRLGDMTPVAVGQVLHTEELKLVDTEEYKHTDQPHPRGELCLRGPFLFKGYYKQPELTKQALDEDGWFHTGDVGSVDAEGRVSIVGRIKALAKNCLGEYIAMEALEAIYSNHPLVLNNCLCVIVNPDRRYIAVVAVTSPANVKKFAQAHASELPADAVSGDMPIDEVIRLPAFRAAATASIAEMGKSARRSAFELPRGVTFTLTEWTPENGVLTAAMKLKRSVIQSTFSVDIAKMFVEE